MQLDFDAYEHPEVILRRRRYGGFVVRDYEGGQEIFTTNKKTQSDFYRDHYKVGKDTTSKESETSKKDKLAPLREATGLPIYPLSFSTKEMMDQVKDKQDEFTVLRKATGLPVRSLKDTMFVAPPSPKKTMEAIKSIKQDGAVQALPNRKELSVTYTDKDGNTVVKKGGNKAWRTNNPGNLSFSSLESAKKAGAIDVWTDKEGHKFGIFPSEEAGEQALRNKLKERRFSYRKNGTKRTIADMIEEVYAPSSDKNDSRGYANFIKNQYNLDVDKKTVEDLDEEEFNNLIKGIKRREGNKAGELIAKNKDEKNSSI